MIIIILKVDPLRTKGAFHLTELTSQTGPLEGLTLQPIQINTNQ